MPYSFNPFSGNFDNTPSTLKGDEAYSTLQSASGDWSTYDYVNSTFLPLTGGTLSGNLAIGGGPATLFVGSSAVGINTETPSEALTVVGNISATGTVVGSNLNVANWDSVYSNVVTNSATNVKTAATTVPGTSAITTIVAVSALPVSPDSNTLYIVL